MRTEKEDRPVEVEDESTLSCARAFEAAMSVNCETVSVRIAEV